MELLQAEQLPVSRWSGGSTIELFLYPSGASYADRDFDVRISTATVEAEESSFTHLPGYRRTLMVLKGELEMVHVLPTGELAHRVAVYEQADFRGDWQTTGRGQVTDFNVMVRGSYVGSTAHFLLEPDASMTIHCDGFRCVLFLAAGLATVNGRELKAGGVVVLEGDESVVLVGDGSSHWVSCQLTQ